MQRSRVTHTHQPFGETLLQLHTKLHVQAACDPTGTSLRTEDSCMPQIQARIWTQPWCQQVTYNRLPERIAE